MKEEDDLQLAIAMSLNEQDNQVSPPLSLFLSLSLTHSFLSPEAIVVFLLIQERVFTSSSPDLNSSIRPTPLYTLSLLLHCPRGS